MPIKYALFENNITADPDEHPARVQIGGSADGAEEPWRAGIAVGPLGPVAGGIRNRQSAIRNPHGAGPRRRRHRHPFYWTFRLRNRPGVRTGCGRERTRRA